eukprot:COSAG02_NODE_39881_length_411_cov_1.554487_1_plen_31_part_10
MRSDSPRHPVLAPTHVLPREPGVGLALAALQ